MGITRAVAGFAVIGAGLALSLTTATGLSAQDIERAVAFGAAVPVGTIGTNRSLGPLLRAGVTLGDRQRRNLRLRLDLEASWLPGDSRALSGSWSGGTLAAISGFGSMVLGETGDPSTAPYSDSASSVSPSRASRTPTARRSLAASVRVSSFVLGSV